MGNDLQQVGSSHQITNILNGKHLKVKKCNLTFEGDAFTDLEGLQITKCVFGIGLKSQIFHYLAYFCYYLWARCTFWYYLWALLYYFNYLLILSKYFLQKKISVSTK